ncbi:MAG: ATP-binding cassette domain-containing protein [Elusimicrobia bacterium]|nr:ATP-binding cassette domain-containing protein [Elusimicrobiota bacterium]
MPAIEVRNLSKVFRVSEKEPGLGGAFKSLFRRKFRTVPAVSDVSFDIKEGELVGFLGANGAGKTTTLKMLSGLLHPTTGTASVLGFEPWKRKPAFQKQFSLVMGHRTQLWWEIPAQETFRLNQEIYEIPEADYKRNIDELVDLLELQDCLSIPVKKLSLGQRMKAELAAAILHRPKLLLLDEPTIGLDVVMQKKVRQFILEYNRRYKATVLLTSHNMDDVSELCPRILIIERGRLLYDGALRSVVERYAPFKLMRADFSGDVVTADLERIGKVLENRGPSATLEVPRHDVSAKAAELLSRFPVVDLTIEETPVQEVVRRLFIAGGKSGA